MTPLPDDRVRVVLVDQDAPAVQASLGSYRALLSEDEQSRAARFHFDADRERFVIGRALTRLLLSEHVGGDPRGWRFATNAHGRPELVGAPPRPIGFNVSHTPGLVACVIATTTEVGVDVEWIERTPTHEIPERFFASSEVTDLRRLPLEQQARTFFDYWTLKEAYIKARGLGLALPLAHFAFQLAPPAAPTIRFDPAIDDDPATWQFAQGWPTARHRLGVAVRRPPGHQCSIAVELMVPRVTP